MRCKICGITSYEDAMEAIEAGADALGFVFYEKSPRYISPSDARKIIKKLPPFVEKVALFVNCDAQVINSYCQEAGATLAQIHFDAPDKLYEQLFVPYIKVIRAKEPKDILQFSDEYRLVDTYCETYGGSGKQLNLEWFKDIDCSKIILAGGLTPQNVSLVKQYRFYGVDVSSGVEFSYGKKDSNRVMEFIKNAKN
ncbi:MAG: N-(5'-phosphoribosyl)anthranilate isomerase [Sulfurimonas sp. RIFOXYD12_FULL_33_39]|uniref:phosphoribosylanthranilate isomerase n=1 Tax=unclassified Sulfurimonas TaxID=2623549 RepID=UPI0008CAA3E9|nr:MULTISPECIES: phosphoribosylanthranilate isomerase [unclassified Sulfurimonas]OHE05440.1 MAG: N-(5'-phosphoribosyl)anthranilate isomerase [Sulfurimonas sp. RIFCSPLOWO2_12_FULL_34_6]OHE08706.1 MAG: N-(5'-phosphoribosyl)anthranilate isomerase [Sulfurimonas sp. RIFOXYD12_FULL_33_39]OHE13991.1 MAG: N-(5'-phosphoribosyl)anthranilate isomerase [Sulfurimonas sp. RIFOXYD2_FULL_34_21]DAB27600.1 MAG TPA: N-(5'-phosphoribosyl)anthranilate isomerase [Sulfurimonas sp. UBA10385]